MYEGKYYDFSEKVFFIDKEVVILKIYDPLCFAKIKLIEDASEMIVDLNCLRSNPDLANSISLGIWR
ncbi:hypothetical protein ABDB91_08905 [Desulfoscipio sp. XC116]|uniref:hypothetical protein n=1 Tax=Desulfoscipio sp. XC116 TaxID=3144975 RepID=UPI00325AB415